MTPRGWGAAVLVAVLGLAAPALAAPPAPLTLKADSPWLRDARYELRRDRRGDPVLVVVLPDAYPIPEGTSQRLALEAAGCAAVQQPRSSVAVPLAVVLTEAGRPHGFALVRRCP